MEFIVSEETIKLIGPFRGDIYRLSVDGCKVPYVHLYQNGDPVNNWTLVVDDRFSADVTEEEVKRWAYVMANAMAVSAGFSCHGPDSQPHNRHCTRMAELGSELVT